MNSEALGHIIGKLKNHPASLESLTAEMILLDFVEIKEIEVHARSTFARAYSKDIQSAKIEEVKDLKYLKLETNREGLYDQLPQGFFHRPTPAKPRDKADKRIEKLKVSRKEEQEARQFFLPFEQEGFFFTAKAEISERELTNPFSSPLRHNLLLDIWPSCANLPPAYYPVLCYILPLSYRIAGDISLMSACYSAVTKYPVSIKYVHPEEYETEKDFRNLEIESDMTLGVDMITAGEPVAELPIMEVLIGPIHRSATRQFLEGGEKRKVMDVLSDALVPLDVTVRFRLKYRDHADAFRLESQDATPSYLGHTTSLL